MPELELYLLGSPRLESNGAALVFDSRKQLALAAYLAMTGQSYTREALITLLWPELEPSRSRAGLRRDLSIIRKLLDGRWLVVEGEIISSDPGADLWLDVAEFRRLLGTWRDHGHPEEQYCPECLETLMEAVELYRRDFLAGFSLRNSASFDEWQFFQAEALRQELAQALRWLVRGFSAQGDFEVAIPYARRWVALDPLHEPAHRELMDIYSRAGQRSAAFRQYKECVRLLDEELGVAPADETIMLYEKLRSPRKAQCLAPMHNLPAQVTPFVGRVSELEDILARLRDPNCRLLTLVGPGGIGKTRLALQAAESLCRIEGDQFKDGVRYVRLGPLQTAEGLVVVVAEALGLQFYERGEPRQQLLAYLRQKHLLLVMDSFENVMEDVRLVTEILRSAPAVRLLVTSRIRLNLRGEHLFSVDGLAYPKEETKFPVREFSAVELFVQGARRTLAGRDWEPDAEELSDVVRVCTLVQGMPLGILMAAAWVEMLSPAEIAAEIERGLDLLETNLQDVPARQHSLRSVFDHSWHLLTGRERDLFQNLSVFNGGLTVEAAREVTGASLQDLRALLGKSFLERGAHGRYEVHELLRSYAREKLDGDSALATGVRDRHSAYFCHWLRFKEEEIKGIKQRVAITAIKRDIGNALAACLWAADNGRVERLYQALNALGLFFWLYGDYRAGPAVLESLIDALERIGGRLPTDAMTVLPALARTLTWRCALVGRRNPSRGSCWHGSASHY